MKKVLVFLADGFEEIEALSVVDVMRRADLKCDLCSIKDEYVRGTHNIIVKSDCIIDDVNQDEYDAIVLPGGLPGADNLLDERVKNMALKLNSEGKIVAAICAAPQTLEAFGLLDDKKCTSYPGFIKGRESNGEANEARGYARELMSRVREKFNSEICADLKRNKVSCAEIIDFSYEALKEVLDK